MEIEVVRADITDEERWKRLRRIEFLSGILLKGIKEKRLKELEGKVTTNEENKESNK